MSASHGFQRTLHDDAISPKVLFVLRACFIKNVFKLSLRIFDKNYSFWSLVKHNFVKLLLQWHNILAYIKHDLPDYILTDFFSGKFWNSRMFKITFTKNVLKSSVNN